MFEKVTCGNCGNQTPQAAACMYCGKPLREATTLQDAVQDGRDMSLSEQSSLTHAKRAESFRKMRQTLMLANVQFYQYLADGSLPGLKRVRVPKGQRAVVISQVRCEELPEGEHEVAVTGIATTVREALQADRTGGALVVCTFPSSQIPCGMVLPDDQDIIDAGGNVDAALKRVSLRTADNLMGTVETTVRLRVIEPARIAALVARGLLDEALRDAPPVKIKGLVHTLAFPFAALRRKLLGGRPEQVDSAAAGIRITLDGLYDLFRLEFAKAIQAAVRQETAETLYDTVQVRERVTEDVCRTLSETMQSFGLSLDRVTTFKFQCEEYDDLLRERGRLELQRQQLNDKRNAADIDAEQKKIQQTRRQTDLQDAQDARSAVSEVERHHIHEQALTDDVSDRAAAERQIRKHQMDAADRAFKREHDYADAQKRIELQKQKMLMAIEGQNAIKQADLDRQLALLEASKDRDVDSLLAVALMQNPGLASAFAAAQQAKFAMLNIEKQRETEAKFREQLAAAHGGNAQMFGRLLEEAVSQWGHVQGEKEAARRPQVATLGAGQQMVQLQPVHGDGLAGTSRPAELPTNPPEGGKPNG